MKTIKVGLIGFGTIGSGVIKVLAERRSWLKEKSGLDIELALVCDKDLKARRPVKVGKGLLTKDVGKILYNPEINIVVELIGGVHPAKDIILEAIRQGKGVVTANKALLAEAGQEIFEIAAKCGVAVGFEASVGGGIPIIRALKDGFVANRLDAIYGIINGTTNFILTKMEDEGLDFKDALRIAQAKGYAEANPALDISGRDSAHKLAILAYLGFGAAAKPDAVYAEGIKDIDRADIQYAGELGYAVKLLAIAKRSGDRLEMRVHPTLLKKDHLIANVKGVYNAIVVKGDLAGEQLFYGEGAGRYPTASAVISDIVDIAKGVAGPVRLGQGRLIKGIADMDKIRSRHYIRLSCADKPGVLKLIAGVLARHRISIASVTQKEKLHGRVVPIVMMTHEALESAVSGAIKEVARLSALKGKVVRIRIED